MMFQKAAVAALLSLSLSSAAMAAEADFSTGPLIEKYGPVANVPGAAPLPANTKFSVSYDVTARGSDEGVNRRFETAARFLNMHSAAGVSPDNMRLAIVTHSGAVLDLTKDDRYGGTNPNAEMIRILQGYGVRFIVCGQSAAFQNVGADDLLPGVEMAVSAMTAHALLQQDGYTLNPF